MSKKKPKANKTRIVRASLAEPGLSGYADILANISGLLETSRRATARAVNTCMTATYWEIGRRIVQFEQRGAERAEYGQDLLKQLGADLTARFGRGYGWRNLYQMRSFYLAYPLILQTVSAKLNEPEILQTLSAKSAEHPISQILSAKSEEAATKKVQTLSEESGPATIRQTLSAESMLPPFPLPWSHYVRLMQVEKLDAREFYETEALRGGVERAAARPANQFPVLRTHPPVAEQSRHAAPRPGSATGR